MIFAVLFIDKLLATRLKNINTGGRDLHPRRLLTRIA
jgi:hypothetical protein